MVKNKILITVGTIVIVLLSIYVYWNLNVKNSVDKSPGVEHPETAGFRVVTQTKFEDPKKAYNFTLIDQYGQDFSLSDLHGKMIMVSFVYTHCPEACPLVAANFKATSDQIKDEGLGDDFAQILITTDPENDSPERLLRYTKALGGDWYFLSGEVETLQKVWDEYSIYWEIKERTKEIVVYHSYKTYLIDQDGFIRYEFVGVWFPKDIIPSIKELLIN
jgi:protein SCO1